MRIKVPHKAKVGHKTFTVSYVSKLMNDGEEVTGMCEGHELSIKISTSVPTNRESVLATLWHEYLHGVLYVSGQAESIGDSKLEEGLVVALENFTTDTVDWKASCWKDWSFEEFTEGTDGNRP